MNFNEVWPKRKCSNQAKGFSSITDSVPIFFSAGFTAKKEGQYLQSLADQHVCLTLTIMQWVHASEVMLLLERTVVTDPGLLRPHLTSCKDRYYPCGPVTCTAFVWFFKTDSMMMTSINNLKKTFNMKVKYSRKICQYLIRYWVDIQKTGLVRYSFIICSMKWKRYAAVGEVKGWSDLNQRSVQSSVECRTNTRIAVLIRAKEWSHWLALRAEPNRRISPPPYTQAVFVVESMLCSEILGVKGIRQAKI